MPGRRLDFSLTFADFNIEHLLVYAKKESFCAGRDNGLPVQKQFQQQDLLNPGTKRRSVSTEVANFDDVSR